MDIETQCVDWWRGYFKLYEKPNFVDFFKILIEHQKKHQRGVIIDTYEKFVNYFRLHIFHISEESQYPIINIWDLSTGNKNFISSYEMVYDIFTHHYAQPIKLAHGIGNFEIVKLFYFYLHINFPDAWFELFILISPSDIIYQILCLGLPSENQEYVMTLKSLVLINEPSMYKKLHTALLYIVEMCSFPKVIKVDNIFTRHEIDQLMVRDMATIGDEITYYLLYFPSIDENIKKLGTSSVEYLNEHDNEFIIDYWQLRTDIHNDHQMTHKYDKKLFRLKYDHMVGSIGKFETKPTHISMWNFVEKYNKSFGFKIFIV